MSTSIGPRSTGILRSSLNRTKLGPIETKISIGSQRLGSVLVSSCPSPSMRGCESLTRGFTPQLVTSHSMLSSPSASQKKYSVFRTSVVHLETLGPSLDSLEPSRNLSRRSQGTSIRKTRVSRTFLSHWSSCTAGGKNRFGIY